MNWKQVAIGEVAEIVSGATPKSSVPEYWGGDISWATPTDLSKLRGKHLNSTERTITQRGLSACSARVLPENSVLFSSRAPIGLVAINTTPMATNQGFKSFVPSDSLDPNFLFWWLKANRQRLDDIGTGATFKEVSKRVVAEVMIPLPPIYEQCRIAAILDKADAIRRKREQALDLADEFLKSVFLEMFGNGEWPTSPLADVVREGTIVTYEMVEAGPECDGGVPYIRTGDLKNGEIVLGNLRHTSPEIASKFARSTVRTGKRVMSIRATVGTTALVPDELDGANLTQGTARISSGEKVTTEYLLHFLRSQKCQDWISRQIKGATFREITLTRLREMEVPIPTIKMQQRFSELAKAASILVNKSKSDLEQAEKLFGSLSQRAFKGEV